jgi:LysM repeat protein
MKRLPLLLSAIVCLNGFPCSVVAQDDVAARAAAIAEREAAEERYKRLSTAVEDLWAAKSQQDRRLASLAEEVKSLRADNSKNDPSKYVTRDELKKLADKLQEVEDKRQADRKLIEDKFTELRAEIRRLLTAAPPSSTAKPPKTTKNEGTTDKPSSKPLDPASPSQEGVWHKVESGNTLSAIVTAYNKGFKDKGRKTSLELVLDANPGLKPTTMKVGQEIFIPLVPQ